MMAKQASGSDRGYFCTYWHLGRKAATIIAPEARSSLPLKSASVMLVLRVTVSPNMMVTSTLMVR